ncbi:DMT family transporter [Anaerovorax sp. IOR16]|uniref:DMT family transporter n=1 Tax=Anaerovorax sp. IOR16 TaxID=2773458 RepID=UPI0019CFB1B9|nr:DMT family transporter [Anaerovorax sp. IOR16]
MTQQLKADGMLVLVTLFWGISYLLIDISLVAMEPFTLNAYRFLFAFFIVVIFAFKKIKNVNKTTLKYSAILGFILVFVYIGATFAVVYTSLSNAGFICALTVVLTPLFGFLFLHQKASKKLILVVFMAVVGIALLTLTETLKPKLGDIFALLSAVAYAIDLLITEQAVKKEEVDAFHLGVYQLAFTGIFMLILSLALEQPVIPSSPKIILSVFILSIFCTGMAFIVQAMAQQYTSASHVGVIFSLEPVFAGVVAYFFAGEVLMPQAYFGAVLMVCSLFVMEIDFNKLFGKKQELEEV